MQESEHAQFMIAWGEDDESSFKRGMHLGSACPAIKIMKNQEVSLFVSGIV